MIGKRRELTEMMKQKTVTNELRTPKNILIGKIKNHGSEPFLEVKRGGSVELIPMMEFIKRCIFTYCGLEVKSFSITF